MKHARVHARAHRAAAAAVAAVAKAKEINANSLSIFNFNFCLLALSMFWWWEPAVWFQFNFPIWFLKATRAEMTGFIKWLIDAFPSNTCKIVRTFGNLASCGLS